MLAEILKTAAQQAPRSKALHWVLSFGGIGLFVIAAIDASVLPLPLPGSADLLILLLVAHNPDKWVLFASIAVAGAIAGAYPSYKLTAKGGEKLLNHFVSERFREPVKGWARRNAFLSIGVPAMLPPPMPLTPFLFAAGALRMPVKKYMAAVTVARILRYGLVAWLAHHYGNEIVHAFRHYLGHYEEPIIWSLAGITVIGGVVLVWRFRIAHRQALEAHA